MLLMKDIVREGCLTLREKSEEVKLPLSKEDKETLLDLLGYILNSQNDEIANKLDLRPGVGLASPQIGVNKRMFAIYANDLEGKPHMMMVVNPKIIKHSYEQTYLPGGEGCLSVDRTTTGVTPRYKEIKVDCYLYNTNKDKLEHKIFNLKDYIAIVFQHEYDHLDGILFVDKLMDEKEALKKNIKPLWEDED